jgi:hypothetical protein
MHGGADTKFADAPSIVELGVAEGLDLFTTARTRFPRCPSACPSAKNGK